MRELKANFTPGPWKHTLRNANEIMTTFHGVQIGRIYIDVTTDNEKEDANLIAAAPDLYDALGEMLQIDGSSGSQIDAAIRKAREALAKARGESCE